MPVPDLVYRRSASLLNGRPLRVSTGALVLPVAVGLGILRGGLRVDPALAR